jgi:hypothetical protein
MKYQDLMTLINSMEAVLGNQETKVQKKLFKVFEKIKPSFEEYTAKKDELRLDNASTDDKGILLTDDKGAYKFSKEGIKKLTQDIKNLNEQEFAFDKINVVNPQGLENFEFLENWTTGIEFIKQEEEEL